MVYFLTSYLAYVAQYYQRKNSARKADSVNSTVMLFNMAHFLLLALLTWLLWSFKFVLVILYFVSLLFNPLISPIMLLLFDLLLSLPIKSEKSLKDLLGPWALGIQIGLFVCMLITWAVNLGWAMYKDAQENTIKRQDNVEAQFFAPEQPIGMEDHQELNPGELEIKEAMEDREDIPIQAACIVKDFKLGKTDFKRALNGVSLCLHKGETLALLGPNGAGKSTLFNILSTYFDLTQGQVKVFGKALLSQKDFFKGVGLVAQDNILWDTLSVETHLKTMRAMRGIPEEVQKDWLELVGLQQFLKNTPTELSTGMKRKLCFIMIAMGNPMYKFLDEVSTGLDPMARKRVREIIGYQKKFYGSATLVTTHDMNEAEKVSDRLMILVNGETCLLDSVGNLQRQTGGWNLRLQKVVKTGEKKVKDEEMENRIKEIFENFDDEEGCKKVEETPKKVVYDLYGVENVPGKFDALHALMDEGVIQDFSLSRKSLEDLFVALSKAQEARQKGF